MKKELITGIEIRDLKCDAPDCDYYDDTITRDMYEACINKPCPKCGANLLTMADYQAVLKMEAIVRWINKYFGWLAIFGGKKKIVHLDMNGTGKITQKVQE